MTDKLKDIVYKFMDNATVIYEGENDSGLKLYNIGHRNRFGLIKDRILIGGAIISCVYMFIPIDRGILTEYIREWVKENYGNK